MKERGGECTYRKVSLIDRLIPFRDSQPGCDILIKAHEGKTLCSYPDTAEAACPIAQKRDIFESLQARRTEESNAQNKLEELHSKLNETAARYGVESNQYATATQEYFQQERIVIDIRNEIAKLEQKKPFVF